MTGFRYFAHLLSFLASILYVQALTINPTTVNETDGTVTFTVTPDSTTGTWFLTYVTVNGTAGAGVDYVDTSGVLTSTGADATFTITFIDNSVYTGDREFVVNITSGASVSDPLPQSITITIIDDELPPVQLEQPGNMTVKESVGELNITLVRFPNTTRTFDIGYYLTGTADETDDFELVTMSPINFAMNQNEAVLTIRIINDKIEEELEWICIYINSTEIEEAIMFYIHIEDNDTPKSFHCLRASQDCKNGTCNISDFNCDCNAGFQGADCSIVSADVDAMSCDSCVNGTCITGGLCVCDPGFAGEACDRSAYYHECTATSFAICFTPFGIENFTGQMFVEDKEAESDCQLTPAPKPADVNDGIPDWCMGYAAVIEFNGTCGDFVSDMDTATYMVNIKIRYTANITKSSDEKVYLTCKRGEAILDSGPRIIDGEDQHFQQVGESEFAPATLKLTKPNGDPLPDPLTSPAVVLACVSVVEVPSYDFVIIDIILAENGREGSDFRSAVLYNEGCFPTPGVIFSGPAYDPSTEFHTMCFSFEAFIFSHDSKLAEPKLVLIVNFTVGNEPDTPVTYSCPGRRKRQAERNEGETLQVKLNIINPDYETSERLENAGHSTCASWLYPAFIGVGVVALSMMIIIIILTVAVCKRFNGRKAPKDVYQ